MSFCLFSDHKSGAALNRIWDYPSPKVINFIQFTFELGSICREDINLMTKYRDVFQGLGKIAGKCKIMLKPSFTLAVKYKKRFPGK